MAFVLRLAIVDPDEATRQQLIDMVSGVDTIWLEGECARYELFPKVVEDVKPDVVLVCVDAEPDRAIELIECLRHQTPTCAVCAVSSSNSGDFILRVMRAGATDFITRPIDIREFVSAVKTAAKRNGLGQQPVRECTIITVAGTTGGVGSTSVAVNLASILASDPSNAVALVDLDLALGDADLLLDAKPHSYSLADIAANLSRLDFGLLQRSLTKLPSGLFLLPRPAQLNYATPITEEVLQRVFGLMEVAFSHVIVDVSKAYNALDLAALRAARMVLLVTQLNLPNLRNVLRVLAAFREWDDFESRLRIIVNRLGPQDQVIRRKKAEEILGRKIFWVLPNDYRLMVDVNNNGLSLIERAPRAEITRSLMELAEAIADKAPSGKAPDAVAPASPARPRWLNWLSAAGKLG